jgi:hypothetical protein
VPPRREKGRTPPPMVPTLQQRWELALHVSSISMDMLHLATMDRTGPARGADNPRLRDIRDRSAGGIATLWGGRPATGWSFPWQHGGPIPATVASSEWVRVGRRPPGDGEGDVGDGLVRAVKFRWTVKKWKIIFNRWVNIGDRATKDHNFTGFASPQSAENKLSSF